MHKLPSLLILLLCLTMTSCAGVRVTDYADQQPRLQLEEFFDGQLQAYGVVKDWRGRVIRKFSADIEASWTQQVGTLDEEFLFDDGEEQTRVWTLTPTADNQYTGTAGDVVGTGQVRVAGNAAFLDYVLRVPYGDSSIDLRIDDRMYLVSSDLLINESAMRKFGFKVGEILLVIQRI